MTFLTLLAELDRLKTEFGNGSADRKAALLRALVRRRLPQADQVARLHEALCFLRAYPDDARVLGQVERGLRAFAARADLRRHRAALVSSGIAGTEIRYKFFYATAVWLARRWPRRLLIDWDAFRRRDRLEELLPRLALPAELPGLDELDLDVRAWVHRMKGPGESEASFLARRFERLPMSLAWRESLYDDLDPPLRLLPGPGTPSRTRARHRPLPAVYQTRPLRRARPVLREAIAEPPRAVREVAPAEGARLIDLAREAMVTRSRDLDAFAYGDRRDVRLVDAGDGLQFACIGMLPERRLLLETVYGLLTLRSGVPIGYVLFAALFDSVEVAYNVFETYRGGESGWVYGRALATARDLFRADAFTIDPYQLGLDNPEALESGAWWFYQKMGFRPREPGARRLMRAELARTAREAGHRSSPAALARLASAPLFYQADRPRADVLGRLSLGAVGLRITEYLARRFGSGREEAEPACAREAGRLLGLPSLRGFTRGERLGWARWSPLVLVLPGVSGWSAADRRALARVAMAKGGRRESDYTRLFDGHRRLRRAVARLATGPVPAG